MSRMEDEMVATAMGLAVYLALGALALFLLTSGALAGVVVGAVGGAGWKGFQLHQGKKPEDPWAEPGDMSGFGPFSDEGVFMGEDIEWQ